MIDLTGFLLGAALFSFGYGLILIKEDEYPWAMAQFGLAGINVGLAFL